jgi:hypothetical protein
MSRSVSRTQCLLQIVGWNVRYQFGSQLCHDSCSDQRPCRGAVGRHHLTSRESPDHLPRFGHDERRDHVQSVRKQQGFNDYCGQDSIGEHGPFFLRQGEAAGAAGTSGSVGITGAKILLRSSSTTGVRFEAPSGIAQSGGPRRSTLGGRCGGGEQGMERGQPL